MKFFRYNLLLVFLLMGSGGVFASNVELPVQGYVVDSNTGDPVDGFYQVVVKLYAGCTADEALYTDTQTVEFVNGRLSTTIDPDTELMIENDDLCLGLTIGDDDEMDPRVEFNAVPYSSFALEADHAATATIADAALSVSEDYFPDMVGAGLTVSNDTIVLDTSYAQTWTGSQTYSSQIVVSKSPTTTSSADASFKINPASAVSNAKTFVIQDNGTDKFSVDKEGDVTIAGNLTVTGQINSSVAGDITSVNAGDGLTGGALYSDATLAVDEAFPFVWTAAHSYSSDVDFGFNGTENISLTSDLAGAVTMLDLVATPSSTSAATSGLKIQQASSANTNGLDSALYIDNADADLALTTGIYITNSGGGGYTTFLDTPSIDISGSGAITGATGITSSGTITLSGLMACTSVVTNSSGVLSCGTGSVEGGDITSVVAGAGLTGGATSGAATVDIGAGSGISVGTDAISLGALSADWSQSGAYDVVLANASSELKILESSGATYYGILEAGDLNADRTLTIPDVSGTIVTTGDSQSVTATMIANDSITNTDIYSSAGIEYSKLAFSNNIVAGDIATDAVEAAEIKADAVGEPELKAVDSASDEECLTYETTTGDFEWQSCIAGSVTASDSPTWTGTHIFNKANAAAGSATPVSIGSTLGIMDGSDAYYGLSITPTNANHTGSSNTIAGINIGGITGDSEADEVGIMVGAGWDTILTAFENDGGGQAVSIVAPTTLSGYTQLTLPTVSGTFVTTGDTGSITATMLATDAVEAAEIKADAVGEAELKVVDAAGDEECLTYESTVGDFEWQACSTGSVTTSDSPTWTGAHTFSYANGAGASATTLSLSPTLGIMNGSDMYTGISVALSNANHTGAGNFVTAYYADNSTADADATEIAFMADAGFDYDFGMVEKDGGGDFVMMLAPTTVSGATVITLPSTTGTLVGTGDTDSVTSTMITNATIAGGDLASNIAITSTGAQDFGGASAFEVPNGSGPTVDAAGELAVDTTDDQLIYYGGAKRVIPYKQTKCITVETLAAGDDNLPMFVFNKAATLVETSCYTTSTTIPTYTLEDNSGNAVTGAGTCVNSGTATWTSTSSGNTFTAGETLRFDTGTAADSSTFTTICVAYTEDAQ